MGTSIKFPKKNRLFFCSDFFQFFQFLFFFLASIMYVPTFARSSAPQCSIILVVRRRVGALEHGNGIFP